MKSDISRRQLIKNALGKHGSAMNIDDIADVIGLPVSKVRQSLTTFDTEIVRTGYKLFDLLPRTHNYKMFRYTPTTLEYKKSVLFAEEDLLYFLAVFRNYQAIIRLIDSGNKTYCLHRTKANKHVPFAHYSDVGKLFAHLKMKAGDDLIFMCQNITTNTFLVRKERREDRDNIQIAMRNVHLADMVADILLHSPNHYEMDLFLVRKYLFVYPYFSDPPPDSLRQVTASDSRFIMTPRDKLLSWNGRTVLSGDELVVGLKKYYFHSPNGIYSPVFIQTDDEFGGKIAYCTHCEERLIWEREIGFRHLHNESEWIDAYVPKEFYEESWQTTKENEGLQNAQK